MDGDPCKIEGRGLAGGGPHPCFKTDRERADRIYANALNAYRPPSYARVVYQYPKDCWLPEGQVLYSVDRDTWLPAECYEHRKTTRLPPRDKKVRS